MSMAAVMTIGAFDDDEDLGLDAYYPTREERSTDEAPYLDQWRSDANLLAAVGYGLGDDAFSGPDDPSWIATVRAFQADARIQVDGIMGPQTRGAASAILAGRSVEPDPLPPPSPSPGGGDQPTPDPSLPIEPASTTDSKRTLLIAGAAVAAVVVVGLVMTKKRKRRKRS